MCFSAPASLAAAGLTGVVGIVTLCQVRRPSEIPLALFPLLFSVQQLIEGALWLTLPSSPGASIVRPLAVSFVLIAQVIWPALVTPAIFLVEPHRLRRRLLVPLALAGALVGAASLVALIESPLEASILGCSIRYANDFPYYSWWPIPYTLATAMPLLISSHRPIQSFGILVIVGYGISAYAYSRTLTSVWCFFAALASLILAFQFARGFARSAHTAPTAT
jgi:hypothetical protein